MKKNSERKNRRLVLLGAGHAHIEVLRYFRMNPIPDLDIVLVNPSSEALYSGMLPGYVARIYSREEIIIDVNALALRAGAVFLRDQAIKINPGQKTIQLKYRPELSYDFVSLNIGSTTGAAPEWISTRPLPKFLERLKELDQSSDPIRLVGAGAAGFELSMAFRARYREREIFLYDEKARLSARQILACRKRDIKIVNERATKFDRFSVLATGAQAFPLVKDSGLPDREGYLLVDATLSAGQGIFGAGDCIQLQGHSLDKAGVYAVREGAVLARNLYRVVTGEPLEKYSPQKNYLKLLNLCDGEAIANWYGLELGGRWAWKWKNHIDQKFMEKYTVGGIPEMDPDCGGCGSKVSSELLCSILPKSENAIWGTDKKEDVALWKFDPVTVAATVDQFRNFGVDPYLFGRIAFHSAASDLYAKNIKPEAALMHLTIPKYSSSLARDWLKHLFAGVKASLQNEEHGCELIGGQTNEGEEWNLGFSLLARAPEKIWEKRTVQSGDALLLTKPIGTGIILAAAMAGAKLGSILDSALEVMAQDPRQTWEISKKYSIHACTDITGFSLLGHLSEMLEGTGLGAELWDIPVLPGAEVLFHQGFQSRMHVLNLKSFPVLPNCIYYDPQTSGGFLYSLKESDAIGLEKELNAAGILARVVGRVSGEKIRLRS